MLNKDFIKNFKKLEYDLEHIYWIKKLDKNGKISIHPIFFNYDSSKILDIFNNVEYDAFKVYEAFGINEESLEKIYSPNLLPYELRKAYSQDGEIRGYYRGAEIELESNYSLYKSKTPTPYHFIITQDEVVKNYNDKIVSKSGLKKICKIYENYFQKEYQKQVDKFNSRNFDKKAGKPKLPYTNYSINFSLDDIYFVVEKSSRTSKKFIIPFAVIIDESTGNNYLKNLKFSKEKFQLNYRVNMETSIRLALHFYVDDALEILKIDDLENAYHLKSKDDSELSKLKISEMSIEEIIDLVNEYEKAINLPLENKANKNKQENGPILEREFNL